MSAFDSPKAQVDPISMRVWSARRLAVALGVLALLGRGARRLRVLLASLLLRLRPAALTSGGSAGGDSWRLFSNLLHDLQAHKVARVLLAADHCVVQPADGLAAYKCVSGLPWISSARGPTDLIPMVVATVVMMTGCGCRRGPRAHTCWMRWRARASSSGPFRRRPLGGSCRCS